MKNVLLKHFHSLLRLDDLFSESVFGNVPGSCPKCDSDLGKPNQTVNQSNFGPSVQLWSTMEDTLLIFFYKSMVIFGTFFHAGNLALYVP